MKNIVKIVCALLLVVNFSCDRSNGNFFATPTSGWVEFAPGSAAKTISSFTTDLSLPLSVNVPEYKNGLVISYTLEAVQGDFTSYVSTPSNVFVDPINPRYPGVAIDLVFMNLNNVSDVVIFDVVLKSVDQTGVTIGVDDMSITKYRVTIPCSINVGTTYNASVTSEGFGITDANNADFDYTATLTQVSPTSYTIDSAWGPNFVAILAGDPSYEGQLVYTGTINLNADGTVTVVGNANSRPGGTGTYDPCADIFVLNLDQATFNGGFGVTTTLTPQ